MNEPLVLRGKIVTFDDERLVIERGAIWIGIDDETSRATIEQVADAAARPPPGFSNAQVIETTGVVYPGLMDLHGHIAYNFLPLWTPPRNAPYQTRYQWPDGDAYKSNVARPADVLGRVAAKEVLKFAEVKALVAGTTSIQGSPTTSQAYEGWMVHNIENETFGTGRDVIYQNVRKLDAEGLQPFAERMNEGASFIYHLAEGVDPRLRTEFDDVVEGGCLHERLIAIHGTALDEGQLKALGIATLVWSPFSNLWLYQQTVDVVGARDADTTVCLGSDWSPTGSKNVLGELKVAHLWNRSHLDGELTDLELCEMVTRNPGVALSRAWGTYRLGQIRFGLEPDFVVLEERHEDPYHNLIMATERDVTLVVIRGRPMYGTARMMSNEERAEQIVIDGQTRSIVIADEKAPGGRQSWEEIVAALERARAQPADLLEQRIVSQGLDAEAFELIPDMPGGGDYLQEMESFDVQIEAEFPPLDTLWHDDRFFGRLEKEQAPILGGVLDDLATYYA